MIADWPTDDIARLIARYPSARLPVRLFLRRLHPPEMPPKVDEEEAEPLKNDVFGSVVQRLHMSTGAEIETALCILEFALYVRKP